ncbi:MAG TPA: ROK family transcriptional regulator [Acidimicrobiales bacterium]
MERTENLPSPFARRGQARRKAVPGDARRHNRSLVLRTLFRSGPLSRADLARETHLTRVTTSDLAAELLGEGLIEELGTRTDQGVGKPATLLGIVRDSRLTVTLDLSDDEVFRAALVDLGGTVLDRRSSKLEGRTGKEAVDLATDLAADLTAAAGASGAGVLGVGVGSPGVVDADGVVLEAPNLKWDGLDLAGHLAAELDVPTHVANDANAAALGELGQGDSSDRSLFLIKVGRGVGAGLVVEGMLVLGDRFAAGEIGHVVVDPRGDDCACGRRGCLETVIAAPRFRQRLARSDADRKVRAAAGRRLGVALAPVVSTLNLREIVLSGPLDLLDETFRTAALDAVRDRTMPAVGDNVEIRPTSLGEDDVHLGAARLVLDRELGVA